jgi:hypothetical protein
MRSRRLALAVTLTLVVLGGCGKEGLTRDQLRQQYVDELVKNGLPQDTAQCVMTKFFATFTDAQLRAFNTQGDHLSDDQLATIGRLTTACTSV